MSIFQEKIQADSNVCNNCFRRTYITYQRTHRWAMHNGELILEEVDSDELPKPRRSTNETERAVLMAEQPASSHMTNVCKCGTYKNSTTLRPLTKRRMIEIGKHLADELERRSDVEIDRDIFFDTLRELKSQEDRQFEDDSIFAAAVNQSCEEVEENPPA